MLSEKCNKLQQYNIYRAKSPALCPTINLDDKVPVFTFPSNSVAQLLPQAPGSFFVAFVELQGYGGGTLTHIQDILTWNMSPGAGVYRRTWTYDRISRRWPSRLAAKHNLRNKRRHFYFVTMSDSCSDNAADTGHRAVRRGLLLLSRTQVRSLEDFQSLGTYLPSCSEQRSVSRSECRYCDGEGHQPGHHPQNTVSESLQTRQTTMSLTFPFSLTASYIEINL
jgi:hypothetical protein